MAQMFSVLSGLPGGVGATGNTGSPLDRGVLLVRYVAPWQLLFTVRRGWSGAC